MACNEFMRLWVDDERTAPDGWDRAYTFHEAIFKLEMLEYKEISLDHDLASFYGNVEMTGYHVAQWLVQRKIDGLYVPPKIQCHSANPVGVKNIEETIKRYLSPDSVLP